MIDVHELSARRMALRQNAIVGAEWPLVGRDSELCKLTALLRSRERRGVVLAGPAGVGKSRLAAECLTEAERAGLPTVRVTATRSGSQLPFGAFAGLLPASDDAGRGAAQGQTAFLRWCCAALAEQGGGKRLVVLVDDAHLLDEASASLTRCLTETGSAFVLLTVRTGEPAPRDVTALWKEGLVERVDVSGLAADAVEALLRAALGAPVERATVARLAARCQGNVLFLRELVLSTLASGALRRQGGLLHLAGAIMPSDRLVELVDARLGNLADAERALLEIVAVGEPLGRAELATVADRTAVQSLERQALLRTRDVGRRLEVRLAHPLYGEVLRGRISALRLRAINRMLADVIEAVGMHRREDTLRFATWRLEGGGPVRGELMLAGAQQARLRWALPLAERLARAAIDRGAGFDASLLLGQVSFLQDRSDEAEAQLAALVAQAADDTQRARLASVRIDNLTLTGRSTEALLVSEQAEAAITDVAHRDAVTVKRGQALDMGGSTAKALELLEPILPRVEGQSLVFACLVVSHGLGVTGRLTEAVEVAQRGHSAHLALKGLPLPYGPQIHLGLHCAALTYAGRLREAESLGTTEYHRAMEEGSVDGHAALGLWLSRTLLLRGRVREAAHVGREAATWYREMGLAAGIRLVSIPAVHALALAGALEEARATLAEIDALGIPATFLYGAELLQARAWTAVAGGDLPAARRHLEEAVALAGANGERVAEAAALHDLARLGYAKDVAARLGELANRIEGDLAPAWAGHTSALASGDAPGLDRMSQVFETLGADLLAAEASADGAVVWRRAGEPRRAAMAERRAEATAARCEGATTPALQGIGTRALLTKAEREVALLAAASHSNREIAESLGLSLRTVENYLHRAYDKLGITGRKALVEALGG